MFSLNHLCLNNNKIKHIHVNSFYGLIRLGILNLSFNELKKIKKNEFFCLKNLTHLYLNNNLIEQIDNEAFALSPCVYNQQFRIQNNLIELNLSNNLIQRIDKETYRRLTLLTKLDLSFKLKLRLFFNNFFYSIKTFNRIKEIVKKEFHYLYSLNHICLNDNQIMQIDPDVFRGLMALKKIELQDNNLIKSLYFEKNVNFISIRNQENDNLNQFKCHCL